MKNKLKAKRVIKDINIVSKLISIIDYYGLQVIKIGVGCEYKSLDSFKLKNEWKGYSQSMVIELKDTHLEITTKYFDLKTSRSGHWNPKTYIFNLNLQEEFISSGHECFVQFSKYFKVTKASTYNNDRLDNMFNTETGKYVCSKSPILDYNKKYENQELLNCYEYDLNSAYTSVLIKNIPDLSNPTFGVDLKVTKGYVGFRLDNQCTMIENGYGADVIFPLIESPDGLKEFCEKYFNKKLNSTGFKKLQAKAMLNLPIGYCQRYNPFLRSYVVSKCNLLIKSKMNSETLFVNTDALFSKTRRTDLDIGENIGQFKEVVCSRLKYIGNTYQIDEEIPVYRGIPKAWFERFAKINDRQFNILEDKLPTRNMNLYNWNWEELRLEKNYD